MFSFKIVQVVGWWKYRIRQTLPEFTSERDERMKMLVSSRINEVDRIGMRESRKSCAARPREGGGMQLASSEEQ